MSSGKVQIYASQITGLVNSIPIGMPIPIFYNIPQSVVNTNPSQFIKLSKDLQGPADYNFGKVGAATANTANETTFYSAVVTDTGSPLFGMTVWFINSTVNTTGGDKAVQTFIGASESANNVSVDTMQGHYISITYPADSNANFGNYSRLAKTGGAGYQSSFLDIAGLVTDGTNGTPRVGYVTAPVKQTAEYYLRFK